MFSSHSRSNLTVVTTPAILTRFYVLYCNTLRLDSQCFASDFANIYICESSTRLKSASTRLSIDWPLVRTIKICYFVFNIIYIWYIWDLKYLKNSYHILPELWSNTVLQLQQIPIDWRNFWKTTNLPSQFFEKRLAISSSHKIPLNFGIKFTLHNIFGWICK